MLLSISPCTSGQLTFPWPLLGIWKTAQSPQPRAPSPLGTICSSCQPRPCRLPDSKHTKPLITPTKHCRALLCAPTWALDLGTISKMARKQMFTGTKGRRPWSSKSNSGPAGQASFLLLCALGASKRRRQHNFSYVHVTTKPFKMVHHL